ncbi:MAG: response regulator [Vicinamibacterales bacterium]
MHPVAASLRTSAIWCYASSWTSSTLMAATPLPSGPSGAGSAAAQGRATGRVKILIVEDDLTASDTMARVLASRGWLAECASSAVEALRLSRRERFDLALVDVGLGGELDGVDVAEWLQRLFHLPAVFVTSTIDEDVLRRASRLRPAGYLVKPVEPEQLYSAVMMVCAGTEGAVAPGDAAPSGQDLVYLRRKLDQIRDLVDEVQVARRARQRRPERLPSGIEELTAREWQIMRDLVEMPDVEAIAERRHLSVHTVQNHLKSVFRKLEVHSTAELLSLLLFDR